MDMDIIFSYQEILQDTFYIKLLLDIKRNVKNKEAKNYLIEFIKDVSSLILYEVATFLDEQKLLSKEQFFTPNMNKTVRDRRQWIKQKVINSNSLLQKVHNMGIDFSQKVYDLNLIVRYKKLLATNFENYDCRYDLDFVDGVLRAVEIVPNTILCPLGLDENTINNIYCECIDKASDIIKKCERLFSGKRFAYSTYKLFSLNHNLTDYDKIFILQRYRLVSSILKLEKLFQDKKYKLIVGPFSFNINSFFRKYKALIIEVLGNDIRNPQSDYLKSIKNSIEKRIKDADFFRINCKLRNNCHYSHIDILSDQEYECLNKYQNIYLNIILKSFNENLYVNIENEDINMTNFFFYCLKRNIKRDIMDKHYPKIYLEFLITHKIEKNKYQ